MTRLPPTCANCGSSASGEGYAEDPRTGKVLCLQCALPNEDQRERVTSEAVAELLRRFERENGRRPQSLQELAQWAPGKMPTRKIVALTSNSGVLAVLF